MALNKVILCALFFSCVTLAPGQPIQELAFRAGGAVYFDRETAPLYELTVRVGPNDYSLPFSLDRDGKTVWTAEAPPPYGNLP